MALNRGHQLRRPCAIAVGVVVEVAGACVVYDPIARVVPGGESRACRKACIARREIPVGAQRREHRVVEAQVVGGRDEIGHLIHIARARRRVEHERVRTGTAGEAVVAAAPVERVVAGAAQHRPPPARAPPPRAAAPLIRSPTPSAPITFSMLVRLALPFPSSPPRSVPAARSTTIALLAKAPHSSVSTPLPPSITFVP